jgi:hypothetical protein
VTVWRSRGTRRWRSGARAAAVGAVLMSAVPLLPAQGGTRTGLVDTGDVDPHRLDVGAAAPDPHGPYPLPGPAAPAGGPGSSADPGGYPSGIPATVLAAYRSAERRQAADQPGCHLHWWMIAGIGRVESNHAANGRVDASGRTSTPILGPRLDGADGFAAVPDTDGGTLDGDRVWDRAVGPMQFIPGAWRRFGTDGNSDGVADPNNVFDAAASAGRYLCDGGDDLNDPARLAAAAYRYNPSADYVRAVLMWMRLYASGVAVPPVDTVVLAGGDGHPDQPAAPPNPAGGPPPAARPAGGANPPPQQSGGDREQGGDGRPAPLDPRCLADLRALGLDPVRLGLGDDQQCRDYLLTVGPPRTGGQPAPAPGKPVQGALGGLLPGGA